MNNAQAAEISTHKLLSILYAFNFGSMLNAKTNFSFHSRYGKNALDFCAKLVRLPPHTILSIASTKTPGKTLNKKEEECERKRWRDR